MKSSVHPSQMYQHEDSILSIYTDGSTRTNPGPGGWAYAIFKGKNVLDSAHSGFLPETTSNRAEMIAAIKAIESIEDFTIFVLYSDSEYLIKGITERISKWIINDWKSRDFRGKVTEIKNQDLWLQLIQVSRDKNGTFVWIKGHSGIWGNEMVDKMAKDASHKKFTVVTSRKDCGERSLGGHYLTGLPNYKK